MPRLTQKSPYDMDDPFLPAASPRTVYVQPSFLRSQLQSNDMLRLNPDSLKLKSKYGTSRSSEPCDLQLQVLESIRDQAFDN